MMTLTPMGKTLLKIFVLAMVLQLLSIVAVAVLMVREHRETRQEVSDSTQCPPGAPVIDRRLNMVEITGFR